MVPLPVFSSSSATSADLCGGVDNSKNHIRPRESQMFLKAQGTTRRRHISSVDTGRTTTSHMEELFRDTSGGGKASDSDTWREDLLPCVSAAVFPADRGLFMYPVVMNCAVDSLGG